jgi:hypothetical protein
MYKVKRTIYVDNQSIDVWFGLVSKTKNGKNGKYTVYLLTDDPNNPYNIFDCAHHIVCRTLQDTHLFGVFEELDRGLIQTLLSSHAHPV